MQLKGGCQTVGGHDQNLMKIEGLLKTKRWYQGKGCSDKLAEQSFESGLCEICQNDNYDGNLSVKVIWDGDLISKQIFGDENIGCKNKFKAIQIAKVGICENYNDNSY